MKRVWNWIDRALGDGEPMVAGGRDWTRLAQVGAVGLVLVAFATGLGLLVGVLVGIGWTVTETVPLQWCQERDYVNGINGTVYTDRPCDFIDYMAIGTLAVLATVAVAGASWWAWPKRLPRLRASRKEAKRKVD